MAGRKRHHYKGVFTTDLEDGILQLANPFSIRDVIENIGSNPGTVKRAINFLEAQGKVVAAGERPNVRGRASKLWKVVKAPA